MGVSAGHLSSGAVQGENPAGPKHRLPQRAEGAATDRRQEGKADPRLEGDQWSFHKGG